MFLELPVTKWDTDKREWVNEKIFINPMHIISIELDPEDKRGCKAICVDNVEYWVIHHTRQQLKKKVEEFLKENVLNNIYKQSKDQQN